MYQESGGKLFFIIYYDYSAKSLDRNASLLAVEVKGAYTPQNERVVGPTTSCGRRFWAGRSGAKNRGPMERELWAGLWGAEHPVDVRLAPTGAERRPRSAEQSGIDFWRPNHTIPWIYIPQRLY